VVSMHTKRPKSRENALFYRGACDETENPPGHSKEIRGITDRTSSFFLAAPMVLPPRVIQGPFLSF